MNDVGSDVLIDFIILVGWLINSWLNGLHKLADYKIMKVLIALVGWMIHIIDKLVKTWDDPEIFRGKAQKCLKRGETFPKGSIGGISGSCQDHVRSCQCGHTWSCNNCFIIALSQDPFYLIYLLLVSLKIDWWLVGLQ